MMTVLMQTTSRIYLSLLTDKEHIGHVCIIFPFNRSLLKACKHMQGVFDGPSRGMCELVGVDAAYFAVVGFLRAVVKY